MHLQTAIGLDESDAAAWALWGDALMALGDTSEAVDRYEKAISLSPKLPSPVLELTRYYLQNDKMTEAERVVAAAEKKDEKGKVDEIKVARGMIFARQGNFPEATCILVNAAAKNSDNPLYPQILARLYNDSGVKEQAAIYYENAWKLAPGDPSLAYEYALVLQDLGRYNEALDLFKVVQEKDPENKTVDYMIARLYYAAGRWGEAAAQFKKATEKRADHFLSQYLLGKAVFEYSKAEKVNYYRQAEEALRKALELKPNRADVALTLAEVLNIEGRLAYQMAVTDTIPAQAAAQCDTCIRLLRETLTFNPATKGVNSYLARAWMKLGNLDSTIYYSRLQLAEKPEDPVELARLISSLQRKKDFPGLVETFKPYYDLLDWNYRKAEGDTSVLPQDKFLEKYAAIYASALVESGQAAQARDLLNTLQAYAPKWKEGYSLNAYIDLRKQNYAGAVPILQAGVRALPDDADLWLLLGDSIYFSNPKSRENIKKAKDAYLRASQLGNKDAKEKYDQLSAVR